MIDSIAEGAGPMPDLKRTPRPKPAPAAVQRADRLPPHSPEAEQGVLGCVLLSPNERLGECIEKLKTGEEVFYDLRHQTIYKVLGEMYDNREAIDLIERDFPKLTGAAGELANAPLLIDDSSALSILQLRAKARRMHQQYGIKLFVVDYLQLLHSTSRRAEGPESEVRHPFE